MAPSFNFLEFARSPLDTWAFDETFKYDDPWKPATADEHTLLEFIREDVLRYRMQSLAHFALHVNVTSVSNTVTNTQALTRSSKIKVVFQNYSQEVYRTCRPHFRKSKFTNKVRVLEGRNFVSIAKSLSIHFPASGAHITEGTMRLWWNENGKTFNWSGLPTELKEHIIQFCMCQPHGYSDYFYGLQQYKDRHGRKPGPYEIIDKLGDWGALLRVSRQMRTITLRLCFVGCMRFDKGLCITSLSYRNFTGTIRRLGKYFQIIEPGSIPVDYKSKVLANCYSRFPKMYPQLKNYATFRHGIRKICIQFDFLSYLHFFKVTAGGFKRYHHHNYMTCDILEQLPHLNGLVVLLPRRPKQWRNLPTQFGPPLFYPEQPCPRFLHRLIYERAADVLAPYKDLTVDNFIDAHESKRFWARLETARLSLKFMGDELDDLYSECGGGVELEDAMDNVAEASDAETVFDGSTHADILEESFFPPPCKCAVQCITIFN